MFAPLDNFAILQFYFALIKSVNYNKFEIKKNI